MLNKDERGSVRDLFYRLYSKFIDVIVCKSKRIFRKEDENALSKRICPTRVFFYDIIK